MDLLNRVGVFHEYQGRLADAAECFRRAVAVAEECFGPEDHRVAASLGNLGRALRQQGELAKARRCLERALRAEEAAYGPDHPEVPAP